MDAAEPAFALPVISTLTDDAIQYLINTIANAIYQQFALYVTFTIINIQTGQEATAVQSALAALITAQQGGNSANIQTALQAFGNAVGALTHIDGSASPGNL